MKLAGTKTRYNQTNYLLIRQIIEKIRGKEYSLLNDKVFNPLNMMQTGFARFMDIVPHRVDGYYRRPSGLHRQKILSKRL